jgi:hypothetical protein
MGHLNPFPLSDYAFKTLFWLVGLIVVTGFVLFIWSVA